MNAVGRGATFSEINVTPLVDVMLVLLIIFMVAAPLLQQGIPVSLPRATTGQQASNQQGLSITITKEHVLYVNDHVVTMKELRRQLAGAQYQPLLIRVDRGAYVSRLVEVWDLCRDVGLTDVRIATISE